MRDFNNIKRIIIKIGSSSLVNDDLSINYEMFVSIFKSFKELKQKGIDVALVTSGAIAVGMHELNLKKRPKDMALKQACAAVGQAKLMEAYNKVADIFNLKTGQILINHDDFEIRNRMLHLSDTLDSMFKNGIVPIINENDALAVDEIKVGDNDTLASLFAPMIHADLLVLFSDIDGLYNKNPKEYDDAVLIKEVKIIDENILKMAGGATTTVGTGGMATKLKAAIISTTASCNMIICNSNQIDKLTEIAQGSEIGTLFTKLDEGISSREHWLIYKTKAKGQIVVDDGLKKKIEGKKVSILPKGIIKTNGDFLKDSIVDIVDINGKLLAKGLSFYSSMDINKIIGMSLEDAKKVLKLSNEYPVIHADDLVLVGDDVYGSITK